MIIEKLKLRQLIRRALQEELGAGSIDPDDADMSLAVKDKSANEIRTKNFKCIPVPATKGAIAAKKEADEWRNMKETDKAALPFLKKYFDSCKPVNRGYFRQHPKGDKAGTSWSAAFVTWCMRHSDGETEWDRSDNHRAPQRGGYLTKTWERRKDVEDNPEKYIGKTVYLAFSANEIYGNGKDNQYSTIKPSDQIEATTNMLTPGDVVGKRRENGKIHMDIYIGGGQVIGGNIGRKINTCESRPLDPETSDVIKRVKITGLDLE